MWIMYFFSFILFHLHFAAKRKVTAHLFLFSSFLRTTTMIALDLFVERSHRLKEIQGIILDRCELVQSKIEET